MKKTLRKLTNLLLVVFLVCGLSVTVLAAGTVTYDGNAQKFVFEPGSDYSPTDLFDEFKEVMPGDKITQQITVKNDSSNEVKVDIYMRSLGAHEDSVDFLSQLHLTVAKSADNEMAYMFDAAADQTDGLTDWVLLGTLYSGGEVNLDVALEIPIELGDDYQNAIGLLDWEFKVVEYPVEDSDPQPPQTGDTNDIYLYVSLMVVTLAVMIVLLILLKRPKEEEDE